MWMALIFFASTDAFSAGNTTGLIRSILTWLFPQISEGRIEVLHLLIRKLAHFSTYAILALLAVRAFAGSSHRVLREHWVVTSALLVIGYSFLDEFHQSFVPSRSASIFDSLIDIAGGLFVLICLVVFKRPRRQLDSKGQTI
ncbi:MAG TPA: VanZ family protein [Pyrinomonadaceae bacterium]|nr:VanZ family protein [Pyrinomonadaceae bacterium]